MKRAWRKTDKVLLASVMLRCVPSLRSDRSDEDGD